MKTSAILAGLLSSVTLFVGAASAANLSMVSGDTGNGLEFLRGQLDRFEAETGHTVTIVPMPSSTTDQFGQYRLWLAAGNSDIDVYQTDVIWAPQLADQFLDLTEAAADVVDEHFPAIIESQTVDGRLVALPAFTDAPALYYRTDLLEKYGKEVPTTWAELEATAAEIMEGERAEGNEDMWGFVFQGNAYEGLTCDALEWVMSNGGGQIVEPDGTISINNPQAAAAIDRAAGWVGTIAPDGVLAYMEEESRGVWQLGNAVFMRNWPYAYALGNGADSAIAGNFDVAPLPMGDGEGARSAATLGGWNVAVSKYSQNPDAAIELALFLSSAEVQKERAINQSNLPTIQALYDDSDIAAAQPIIPRWKEVFENSVPRPSAPTKTDYNEVSSLFWGAVHETLSGNGSAAENLEILEIDLEDLRGDGW
ncbi:ABC transporter substrate-binding protein [Pelagibacterium xiamenense]|uniref:ABC transporter substrate-binding protein n=1 Tax=Pelagibacterium xiamenense TaxID=2901140 RepID=UPI001E43F6D9|nr:ABC transporter substrate-binding protein [Pelagibacterium xiamenense]MCD7058940.1 ABC transporter substrate-binding protein [Pelagibacterium xiamenense]